MICRRILTPVAAVLLALLLFPISARATPVYPPGLRIGLEPIGNLTVSRRFPGFEDSERKVSVTILDLPSAAYNEISRSTFAADQHGMTNVKRDSFVFSAGVGVLLIGDAAVDGTVIHRYFLVASPAAIAVPDLAMLIRIEVPDAARATYSDAAIRKMLASVSFRKVPTEELLGLLPFKLDPSGFRVVRVLPGGVMLTEGAGEDLSKQPYAIINVGGGAPDRSEDRGRFARDLLSSAPINNLQLTSAEPMRIGGMAGYEIRAKGTGLRGEKVALVQWLRFASAGGSFIRVIGVAPEQDWDNAFNRFRALRDGIALR